MRVCIQPRLLKKGDRVGLCAPSGFVSQDALAGAISALAAFGLQVVVGESCRLQHGYLAGTDKVRAQDFNHFVADDGIAGIFAVRGGYGAQRILPLINWNAFKRKCKPFFGYSDATAIHLAIQRLGIMSYHTPMPATELRFGLDAFSRTSYEACLFGGTQGVLPNLTGHERVCISSGVCKGILAGGNLSLLASSLGTPYALDARGKVLFIEEVGEAPYRIDRMLTQLVLAGVFDACAGILLGAFTECYAQKDGRTVNNIIKDMFTGIGKPVLAGVACGHTLPTLSLPFGAMVRVDAHNREIVVL